MIYFNNFILKIQFKLSYRKLLIIEKLLFFFNYNKYIFL